MINTGFNLITAMLIITLLSVSWKDMTSHQLHTCMNTKWHTQQFTRSLFHTHTHTQTLSVNSGCAAQYITWISGNSITKYVNFIMNCNWPYHKCRTVLSLKLPRTLSCSLIPFPLSDALSISLYLSTVWNVPCFSVFQKHQLFELLA